MLNYHLFFWSMAVSFSGKQIRFVMEVGKKDLFAIDRDKRKTHVSRHVFFVENIGSLVYIPSSPIFQYSLINRSQSHSSSLDFVSQQSTYRSRNQKCNRPLLALQILTPIIKLPNTSHEPTILLRLQFLANPWRLHLSVLHVSSVIYVALLIVALHPRDIANILKFY